MSRGSVRRSARPMRLRRARHRACWRRPPMRCPRPSRTSSAPTASEYQAVVKQAAAFHNEFTQALAAAGNAYANAEGANAATLGATSQTPNPQFTPISAELTLFLGPTGIPTPTSQYVTNANNLYVRSTNALQALFTPEEFYPLTGVKSMTLNSSVSRRPDYSQQRDHATTPKAPQTHSPSSATRKAPSSPRWKCRSSRPWVPWLRAQTNSTSCWSATR